MHGLETTILVDVFVNRLNKKVECLVEIANTHLNSGALL